jgi:hypothetical protein
MAEQTIKTEATPLDDAVQALAADPILTRAAKVRRIAAAKAAGAREALAARLPHTFTRKTRLGTVAVTIHAVDNLVAGQPVEGAVGVRLSATLDGKPLDIDPDREFVNPPLRFVTPDGENETTIPASIGPGGIEIPARSYRWREDPVACIRQDIAEQIRAELEAKRAG